MGTVPLRETRKVVMINAKNEVLREIEYVTKREGCKLLCCELFKEIDDLEVAIRLRINYTPEAYKAALDELDFEYGFSDQMVYGIIWYDNETWSDRIMGDDGQLYWQHHRKMPEIPRYLRPNPPNS